MIEIRQYKKGDEKKIESVEQNMSWHPDYQKNWDSIVKSETTWTAFYNDKVHGIAGYIPKGDSAIVWALISKELIDSNVQFFRIARIHVGIEIMKQMMQHIKSIGFKEILTYCKDGFAKGERFLEYLGFVKVEYTPKSKYRLYKLARK